MTEAITTADEFLERIVVLSKQLSSAEAGHIIAEITARDREVLDQIEMVLAAKAEAEPVLATVQDQLNQLREQLAESQADAIRLGSSPDLKGQDKVLRRAAILELAQANQDVEDLTQRVAEAELAAKQAEDAIGPILTELRSLQNLRNELAAAAADPFGHPISQATLGYQFRLIFGSLNMVLLGGLTTHPEYPAAQKFLFEMLSSTGIGAMIEQNIEDFYKQKEGPVKRTADGVQYVPHGLTREEALLIANRAATQLAYNRDADARAHDAFRQGTGATRTPGVPGVNQQP